MGKPNARILTPAYCLFLLKSDHFIVRSQTENWNFLSDVRLLKCAQSDF